MTKIQQYQLLLQDKYNYSEELLIDLLKQLLTEKRYNHVLRVLDTSIELAQCYNISSIDISRLRQAVLFHDLAKGMKDSELKEYASIYNIELGDVPLPIYHAIVGAWMLKYFFNIHDEQVLNAVYYHTTGHISFLNNTIGALLYIADYLEPGRAIDISHIKQLISQDLKLVLRAIVKNKICDVIKKERIIDNDSVYFYNSLL